MPATTFAPPPPDPDGDGERPLSLPPAVEQLLAGTLAVRGRADQSKAPPPGVAKPAPSRRAVPFRAALPIGPENREQLHRLASQPFEAMSPLLRRTLLRNIRDYPLWRKEFVLALDKERRTDLSAEPRAAYRQLCAELRARLEPRVPTTPRTDPPDEVLREKDLTVGCRIGFEYGGEFPEPSARKDDRPAAGGTAAGVGGPFPEPAAEPPVPLAPPTPQRR